VGHEGWFRVGLAFHKLPNPRLNCFGASVLGLEPEDLAKCPDLGHFANIGANYWNFMGL
jgi:hypothetical protein